MSYADFVARKMQSVAPAGLDVPAPDLPMFPHQRALTEWALRRGRAAVFADTGLGKTRIELAWANAIHTHTGVDVLIIAPLAVAAQTVAEAHEIGVPVTFCRDGADVRPGINVTNYERLHRFDCSRFGAVALDESSCIKHHTSKTLQTLMDAFARTPYRLCATATPAPNDWTELGTHAEFLGVCTRTEMLAEFFIHDAAETQVWRLKGHARELFWRWVSQWGAMVRKPSDLGFDDSGYILPALSLHEHTIRVEVVGDQLFATEAASLSERRQARKESVHDRVDACASLVNAHDEPWIVWCELNSESEMLTKAIRGAVEVRGSDDIDVKESRLADFAAGRIRVLVTKPSIAGFGLNWQHCARMAFVGVTDSWESYYQAVRRCWRFGQRRPVSVHIFASEREGAVVANLKRKERDALAMAESLSAETRAAVRESVIGATTRQTNVYDARAKIIAPSWLQSEAA